MRNREVLIQLYKISLINLALTALMLLVYALIGRFSSFILRSAVLGCLISCISFLVLSMAVSRAADMAESGGDHQKATLLVQSTSTARLIIILAVYALFFKFNVCDPIASLIPLIFTRFSIYILEFFRKDGADYR